MSEETARARLISEIADLGSSLDYLTYEEQHQCFSNTLDFLEAYESELAVGLRKAGVEGHLFHSGHRRKHWKNCPLPPCVEIVAVFHIIGEKP